MNDHGGAPSTPAIQARDLVRAFEDGSVRALDGVTFDVARGETVAVMGPSGSGKTTLLNLLGALDRPTAGRLAIAGCEVAPGGDLDRLRAREIGFVFQLHNLIPTLSASENVQIPMFELKRSGKERRAHASRLLALVGLEGKDAQRPTQLSGGERQRVAIARALANEAPILLADEPTGSLDSKAGARILDLLEELRAQRGLTIIMVTHDMSIAARADRIVRMLDGRVVSEERLRERPAIASAAS